MKKIFAILVVFSVNTATFTVFADTAANPVSSAIGGALTRDANGASCTIQTSAAPVLATYFSNVSKVLSAVQKAGSKSSCGSGASATISK